MQSIRSFSNATVGTPVRSSYGARRDTRLRVYDPQTAVSTSNPYSSSSSYSQDPYGVPSPAVGARVEKWLKTPFDIAAFGPRAAAGALLSLPERLSTLQSDVQKYVDLMQDPRPLDEKQSVLLREAEDILITVLERGATVEVDVLANLKTILPVQASDLITDFVPPPPNAEASWSPSGPASTSGYSAAVAATAPVAPPVTYYQADVLANQLASELTEIKAAVTSLKNTLEAVRLNNDFSKANLLRQSLREARDLLARRLNEVSPATSADASINAAAREARILLDEVDAQFFI